MRRPEMLCAVVSGELCLDPACRLLTRAMEAMTQAASTTVKQAIHMESPQPRDCLRCLCVLAQWRMRAVQQQQQQQQHNLSGCVLPAA